MTARTGTHNPPVCWLGEEKKNSGRNRKLTGERNHEKSEIVKKAERALPNESESVTQLTRSAPCLHVGLFVFPWRTHRATRMRMRALFLSNFSNFKIGRLNFFEKKSAPK